MSNNLNANRRIRTIDRATLQQQVVQLCRQRGLRCVPVRPDAWVDRDEHGPVHVATFELLPFQSTDRELDLMGVVSRLEGLVSAPSLADNLLTVRFRSPPCPT